MVSSPQQVNGEDDNSKSPDGLSSPCQQTNSKETRPLGTPTTLRQDATPDQAMRKPSLFKRVWAKLGITPLVVMIMVKPAVAATIAMAIYQSHKVASHYLNLGYLIIVISITTVPILPRGKFLLNLLLSLFLTCLAAAIVGLGQWAGIKARQHTTASDASPAVANGYNSSASAVNAIFLMFNIFCISVLRALRPALTIPGIQFTIFVMVGFVYGPQEPTEAHSRAFLRELFYSFLTGQAISAGVSLFIIPVSSRKVFFGETTGFLQSCRGLLRTQLDFLQVLHHVEPSPLPEDGKDDAIIFSNNDEYNKRSSALKAKSTGLLALGAKLHDDVMFAKRELAYGHLNETDIHILHKLMKEIMIPITGLSTIADIAERTHCRLTRGQESNEWVELYQGLAVSFETVVQHLDESLLHILILLQLVPSPKKKGPGDVEPGNGDPKPGDLKFGDGLDERIREFRKVRSGELQTWAKERGLSSVFGNTTKDSARIANLDDLRSDTASRDIVASKRLHIVLYMEYLLYCTALSIAAMVHFAESKVADGTMSKKRVISPAYKTLSKIIKGLINGDEPGPEEDIETLSDTVSLGDSFRSPRDPEHLPPKNARQAWGNYIRAVPRFLGSDAVRFGVRVTIGTISIGIMAYLKDSHAWFIKQRVVWAVVMVAVGMTPTAGSAVFNLLGNTLCTVIGMAGSYINWYMVDGKTAGVIVFFFFFLTFYFYFAAKFPRFLVAIVAGALTHVLVIGYELQVRVIGVAQATATGQEFYPIYELAPFRLLTVAGGCVVAFIWTIFPVPITEASILRRSLGVALFLLANYTSAVTATVDERLERTEDERLESSPGRRLEKMRTKILAKEVVLVNSMRQNLAFSTWEPRLGGDFPRKIYKSIIDELQNQLNYLTIIAYASESLKNARKDPNTSKWISEFARSRLESDQASHKMTSILALLAASIRNAHALPPYLKAPADFRLSDGLIAAGTNVLDLSNVNEPGFRAIAVIEVAQRCLADSLDRIVEHVRELVGEVDFTFHIRNTSPSSSVLNENGEQKAKVY